MTHSTLSIADVAQSLECSEARVRSWIAAGELRAVNLSAKPDSKKPRLRVRQADLDAFLDRRGTASEPAAPRRARPRRPATGNIPNYV